MTDDLDLTSIPIVRIHGVRYVEEIHFSRLLCIIKRIIPDPTCETCKGSGMYTYWCHDDPHTGECSCTYGTHPKALERLRRMAAETPPMKDT